MANTGVFTDAYREKYAQLAGDLVANEDQMPLAYFAVGEGGYQLSGGTKVPKTPSAARTALEATIDSRDPSGTSATGALFVKALAPGSVVVAGNQVTITMVLDAAESDLDSRSHLTGNLLGDPEIFEFGVFDGDPVGTGDPWADYGTLMVYGTLDEIVKTSGTSQTITVVLIQ